MAAVANANKVFVSRLRWTVCASNLRDYFSKFGKVKHAEVVFDRDTGWSKNYGFVSMETEESLKAVLEHQPHFIDDNKRHQIGVSLYTGDKRRTTVNKTTAEDF